MSVLLQDAYLDKLLVLNAGDLGSIPGLEKSPGERKGYPLQYPGLENSMECKVHGVAKSQTQPNDLYLHFLFLTSFFFLASRHSMQDLSSPTRDGTAAPCSGSVELLTTRLPVNFEIACSSWIGCTPVHQMS